MTHLVLAVTDWLNINAILEYFGGIARYIKREREIQKTVEELSALTDQELRDIGLSRGMIRSVAMEAYYDNRDNVETNKNLKGWV